MSQVQIENYKETDWDEQRPKATGAYLRLSEKGQKIKVRIVSKPIAFTKVFTKDDGTEDRKPMYAVKCIYRNTEEKRNEVKGFEFTGMVYDAIQTLFQDADYGNPIGYDIEVCRTEEKGRYYTVTPKPPKPLTEEEKGLVASSDVDLYRMYVDNESEGAPSASDPDPDDDPFAEV